MATGRNNYISSANEIRYAIIKAKVLDLWHELQESDLSETEYEEIRNLYRK
jgi:hypothetical protein